MMTKEQVFARLAERGASKAVVPFYGGNDEGFCEGIQLLDSDGIKFEELEEAYEEHWYDSSGYHTKPLTDPKDVLSVALCAPVYDRYGSFAGEFSVSGKVVWDVKARTVKIEESYGQMEYTDSSYDY